MNIAIETNGVLNRILYLGLTLISLNRTDLANKS
jgi:hypothetical protein